MGDAGVLHGAVHHGRRPGQRRRAGGAGHRASPASPSDDLLAFTGVLLWGSGLLSGIVDNIPYVASMSPVVAEIIGPDGEPQVLWWALALGADLGGNATLIGASANVVVAGIAARNGTRSASGSSPATAWWSPAATLAVSTVYVWLRYFVLAG